MARRRHHTTSANKTRVAVYARFSCEKQRDASIEDQLYEAERYCEKHGYEIVRAYTDYAISGRSDDRPQFLQMMEDAKKSAFEIVLVWKMDRFARNMQDQFFHEKILNDHGVRLESIKENISGNGIEASLSKGMHAIFAQIRSQQSAEDTMRGMLGKARKCQYLGYKWLGYSHEGDEIILDEHEAPIVEEIHTRYLQGHSIKSIARWLGEQGVKTSKGAAPGYCYVNNILRSWRYAGEYTWGFEKNAKGEKLLDESGNPIPLVRVVGGIPAIVSIDTKQRCIERLEFRKHCDDKVNYHLSGKMTCSECHSLMRGESCRNHAGDTYFHYTCQGQRKACLGAFWKDKTEHAIAGSVRDALHDAGIRELIAQKFEEYRAGKRPEAAIDAARKSLANLDRQRANIVKAIEDGLAYKHVQGKMDEIDREYSITEARLREMERAEVEITKADVLNMLEMIAKGARTDGEIIDTFITQVVLYESHAIAFLPFNAKTDSGKQQIECLLERCKSAGQDGGSYVFDWHTVNKTIRTDAKDKPPVIIAPNGIPVILLESGIGIVASLVAA